MGTSAAFPAVANWAGDNIVNPVLAPNAGKQMGYYDPGSMDNASQDQLNQLAQSMYTLGTGPDAYKFAQGGSLSDALAAGQNMGGNAQGYYSALATNPLTARQFAGQQMATDPMTSSVYGQGGAFQGGMADYSKLMNNPWTYDPTQAAALQQGYGLMAQQSGQAGNQLAQTLAARGFGGGASGAADQAFGGIVTQANQQMAQMANQMSQYQNQLNFQKAGMYQNMLNQYQSALGQQQNANAGGVNQLASTLNNAAQGTRSQQETNAQIMSGSIQQRIGNTGQGWQSILGPSLGGAAMGQAFGGGGGNTYNLNQGDGSGGGGGGGAPGAPVSGTSGVGPVANYSQYTGMLQGAGGVNAASTIAPSTASIAAVA